MNFDLLRMAFGFSGGHFNLSKRRTERCIENSSIVWNFTYAGHFKGPALSQLSPLVNSFT